MGSGNNGTTTYGYDAFGSRVFQIATTSTTTYPFKWYSVASTTKGATLWATTTEYLFNADTLLATADQQFADGVATSSEEISYIHPDHLGSVGVTTDENGEIESTKDFYPFGEIRINNGDEATDRGYIGERLDDTGLQYLHARFYDPARGQFTSQDPVFLALGNPNEVKRLIQKQREQLLSDPQQLNSGRTMGGSNSGFASGWRGNMQSRAGSISQAEWLADPQMQNSYAYARGNPIRFSDPTGLWYQEFLTGQQSWSSFYGEVGDAANTLGQTSPAWNFAMNHPYTTGAVVGVASAGAAQAGLYGTVALKAAAYPGVGLGYSASRVVEGTAYLYLAQDSLRGISSTLTQLSNYNLKSPTFGSSANLIYNAGMQGASTFGGERVGGIADTLNLLSSTLRDLSKALSSISSKK